MPTETPGVTGASTIPTGTDIATQALTDKLISSSEAISSFSTGAEKAVQEQIANTKLATAKSSAAIESAAEREKAFLAGRGESQLTGQAEGERGYGRVLGAYRELAGNTDKEIKDLEQRKQELILQNDATGLREINTLITSSLKFKQEAMQQTFSNLLNVGQFQLQKDAQTTAATQFKQSFDLQKEQNKFTQDNLMADLALKYGVTVMPGDTISSVAKRAAPNASKEQQARIASLAKNAEDTNTSINIDSTLMDAVSGNLIDDKGNKVPPQSPALAALSAANYMKTIGITPTRTDINNFVTKATKMQEDYTTQLEKTKAEAVGNSFWGNFSNFFGEPATNQAQKQVREKISTSQGSASKVTGSLGYDPESLWANLFQ